MHLSQQRLQFGCSRLGRRLRSRIGSGKPIAQRPLRRFRGQQSLHVTVAYDEAGDLETRLLCESRAQVYVMPQVVYTKLQPFQGKCRSVPVQARRFHLLRRTPEFEDGDAWHVNRLSALGLPGLADQAGAELRHHQGLLHGGLVHRG